MASLRLRAKPRMRGLMRQGGIARDRAAGKYRFTVWVRCRNLHPDWIIRVGVEQCRGGAAVRTRQNTWVSHGVDTEWTPTRLDVALPEDATELGVFLGLWYKDKLKETPPPGGGEVWFDDVSLEPVGALAGPAAPAAPAPRDGLELRGLFPMGVKGLFLPGEPIRLMLIGRSTQAAEAALDVAVGLKDFFGKPAGSKAFRLTLAPGKEFREPLDFPAPDGLGFFCAEATLSRDGELLAAPQTSFCVLPKPGPKDPYFVSDVNGAETEMVSAMQWMGVAGRKIGVTHASVPQEERGQFVEYCSSLVTTSFVERGSASAVGPRAFPLAIRREGVETLYELAIPWEGLKPLLPQAGKAFAFSFVLFDADGEAEKQAGYWLGLTPGIANGQDPSAYRTFVLGR